MQDLVEDRRSPKSKQSKKGIHIKSTLYTDLLRDFNSQVLKNRNTHLDQGYSVSIRTCYRNIDEGFSESWSTAFFGPTVRAMESIIWAQALVLCIDMLALLAWLVLTTCARQTNVVRVITGHTKGNKLKSRKAEKSMPQNT